MAKNFELLRAPIMADPVRRERVEQYTRAMCDALALVALREAEVGEHLETPFAKDTTSEAR